MKKVITALLVILIVLSGCTGGNSVDKKVYSTLESVEDMEEELKKNFKQLAEQELEEANIYQNLINNQEEASETHIIELEASIEERKKYLEKESELMKEINKDLSALNDIKHESELLLDLEAEVKQRDDHFQAYEKSYSEQLSLLTRLIKQLNNPEVDASETIANELDKLDTLNQTIQQQIQSFNEITDEMNVLKKEYYKKIDIQL